MSPGSPGRQRPRSCSSELLKQLLVKAFRPRTLAKVPLRTMRAPCKRKAPPSGVWNSISFRTLYFRCSWPDMSRNSTFTPRFLGDGACVMCATAHTAWKLWLFQDFDRPFPLHRAVLRIMLERDLLRNFRHRRTELEQVYIQKLPQMVARLTSPFQVDWLDYFSTATPASALYFHSHFPPRQWT